MSRAEDLESLRERLDGLYKNPQLSTINRFVIDRILHRAFQELDNRHKPILGLPNLPTDELEKAIIALISEIKEKTRNNPILKPSEMQELIWSDEAKQYWEGGIRLGLFEPKGKRHFKIIGEKCLVAFFVMCFCDRVLYKGYQGKPKFRVFESVFNEPIGTFKGHRKNIMDDEKNIKHTKESKKGRAIKQIHELFGNPGYYRFTK